MYRAARKQPASRQSSKGMLTSSRVDSSGVSSPVIDATSELLASRPRYWRMRVCLRRRALSELVAHASTSASRELSVPRRRSRKRMHR
jgi:hypothetical protein